MSISRRVTFAAGAPLALAGILGASAALFSWHNSSPSVSAVLISTQSSEQTAPAPSDCADAHNLAALIDGGAAAQAGPYAD